MSHGLLKHAAPTELTPLFGRKSINIKLLTELCFPALIVSGRTQAIHKNASKSMCESDARSPSRLLRISGATVSHAGKWFVPRD
jgi:hypothetical protein